MTRKQEKNQIQLGDINPIEIIHPSVILIIGRRRYGKSALGFYILQKFHEEQPELKIFVVSLPKEKHSLLPDWITPVDIVEDLPDNCIALIDEGALKYHAYTWGQKETIVMDKIISISGQKGQTFIFITHTMRKFAITLLMDINILLCKKPSLLHSKLERSEVRKLVGEVSKEFDKLPDDEVKKNTYVISDDFKGFIKNKLPSFWSEDLSKSYAGISLNNKKEEETAFKEDYPKDRAIIVHRIANRLGLVATKDPDETIKCFSDAKKENKNIYEELEPLVEIGKKYCHEQNPECSQCDMNDGCEWFESQLLHKKHSS